MMSKTSVCRVILLLFVSLWAFSCQTAGIPQRRDPSDIPFHVTVNKNTADAYWQFLERYSQSPHANKAKENLAELLVAERDKEKLRRYSQNFPNHAHLVAKVLNELETEEKINAHLQTNIEDGDEVTVHAGEVIMCRGYFKAYVGLADEMDLPDDVVYEARLERTLTPNFISLKLLPDKTFIMVDKFHALINLYYKIEISRKAPPGKYEVGAIIEAYQVLSPEEEYLKGAKKVNHVIEVANHSFSSTEELKLDFEAVSYFKQQQNKVKKELDKLTKPEIDAFGTKYLYRYNMTKYNVRLEEYKTSQAEACYHLQLAAKSQTPEISAQAQAYLDELRREGLFADYTPIE